MRRIAWLLGLGVGSAAFLFRRRIACWSRGWHDGKRQFIGGARCLDCGAPTDLGSVRPDRRQGPRREVA